MPSVYIVTTNGVPVCYTNPLKAADYYKKNRDKIEQSDFYKSAFDSNGSIKANYVVFTDVDSLTVTKYRSPKRDFIEKEMSVTAECCGVHGDVIGNRIYGFCVELLHYGIVRYLFVSRDDAYKYEKLVVSEGYSSTGVSEYKVIC